MVMIEAMACGTPVIAYRLGSVPEVVDEGTTGFIVDSIDDAVGAVRRIGSLDRSICRRVFEERFSPHISRIRASPTMPGRRSEDESDGLAEM
jgi:glycosyltransferase involved in cell wall biosynthesis